jgi:hypothetical protein
MVFTVRSSLLLEMAVFAHTRAWDASTRLKRFNVTQHKGNQDLLFPSPDEREPSEERVDEPGILVHSANLSFGREGLSR